MQWTLILLSLMGQCPFYTCHLFAYHFIKEHKTWDEAQKFCRENYTDLATVSNMTDMWRLIYLSGSQDEAWIGLYSNPGKDNRVWHWSLPGVEFDKNKTRWREGEPNDFKDPENCVQMTNRAWNDINCLSEASFVCYSVWETAALVSETGSSQVQPCNVNFKTTWPQAQSFCRTRPYTDLISGLDQLDLCSVQPDLPVWIGLFKDTWRWSDGSNSSFRYWESLSPDDLVDGQSDKTCATLNRAGRWSSDDCSNTKPFICYDDEVILIRESKTWVEALKYCRENHHDLVSITNPHQQRWIQERVKNADSPYVWLGLRYSCTLDFWFWVTDSRVTFTNWAETGNSDDCDVSAAMKRGGANQWFKLPDNNTFNFICF